MARYFTALLALAAFATTVSAFSINGATSSSSKHMLSRRDWMTNALVAGTVVLTPLAANADVTNKVASSTALRNVKRSLKKLDSLELYVTENNYEDLKAALRVAPLADVRKNMSVIVRGGEDGPDAALLQTKYQMFIQGLEQMDTTAGLAMRGRKIPDGMFYDKYKVTVAALNDFLTVAEESVGIPVQYAEETS